MNLYLNAAMNKDLNLVTKVNDRKTDSDKKVR